MAGKHKWLFTPKPQERVDINAEESYLAFRALASKVDKFYSKELQDIFNSMNVQKLYEVGYGDRG